MYIVQSVQRGEISEGVGNVQRNEISMGRNILVYRGRDYIVHTIRVKCSAVKCPPIEIYSDIQYCIRVYQV